MLNYFIERPVFSTVIALVMILVGALTALELPIAQYPQVVPPQVTVSTSFAGANAEVVAQSVAAPIEQQVNGSQDMLYMSSKSGNDGSYNLTVTFDIGTDKNIDAVEVQNRVAIAQSQLPADVIRSGITVRKSTTDFLEVIALTSPERRYDGVFLSNYALLNLYDALGRVPGVGQVRIFGARDYSMRIWLNPERMARLGVTASDIANVVREQNVVAPAGGLGLPPIPQGQQVQYTVFVKGRLGSAAEFENIVLREAGNGQVVRLKDVARVELAAADYSISGANDDIPAALIGIFLQPDANALDTAKKIRQVLEDQAPRFPPGMVYTIPYSTVPFVTESLKEVVKTLGIAFVLVIFVVYLFLQSWRATLIPILVVPISLIGTFGAFAALGFSINTLTLFGLILAIGIVVDDAIVVVEAVQQRLDAGGLTPMEATKSAIADVGGPVIAIALVLAAVFVPVAFLGGLTGQLYKQFALTLAISVILSAICALTFTPAMCALLLLPVEEAHPRHGPLGWFFARFNALFERSRNGYVRSVALMQRYAVIVMLTFVVLLAAAWGLISTRPTGLVPPEDQGYVLALVNLPAGAALERTNVAMSELTRIARDVPGVDGVVYISGFNLLTGQAVSYNGTAFIRLKPWDQRKAPSESVGSLVGTLMGRLNAQIKDANVLVLNPPPIRGLSTAGGFTFVLQNRVSSDPLQLSQVLEGLLAEARKRPEIGFVYSGFDPRIPQVEFQVDRDKVKSLGIPLNDVFFALQTFPWQLLHQRLQSLRSHVSRPGPGRRCAAQPTRRRQPLLRARRQWDDGAALDAREQPADQRSAILRALQRIQLRDHQWEQRGRLQFRPGHRGDGGNRTLAASGLRLRVERGDVPGKEDWRSDGLYLRGVTLVRDPRAGRALRELGDADRHPAGDSVRHVRRVSGTPVAKPGQQRLYPDRTDHVDRAGGQECHPHRRIRQDQA